MTRVIVFGLIVLSVIVAAVFCRRREVSNSSPTFRVPVNKTVQRSFHPTWPAIESLPTFDWASTPPAKLRPFKPTYNITMAIQRTPPSDLIIMDNNYLGRVSARRRIIADHGSAVVGAVSSGHAPIREPYSYLLGSYLPTRFPAMFNLGDDPTGRSQATFHNKVTDRTFPLRPPPSDPCEMRSILGETVEDDLFLLLRDGDDSQHRAVAFVCCHPSGFDPSEKLGMRLVDIHGPVPAYEKIGASMERHFARLEVGKGVRRANWAIQTHPELYAPSGNYVDIGAEIDEQMQIDFDKARFRVEQQTLTRLPKTQAILFSFKTYMYPLSEIKAEGLGPQLAQAIEGLKTGNAPDMWAYKGGATWGRIVCEYLKNGAE